MTIISIQDKKRSLEEGPLSPEVYNVDSEKYLERRNSFTFCVLVMKVIFIALLLFLVLFLAVFVGPIIFTSLKNKSEPVVFRCGTYDILDTADIEDFSLPNMPDDSIMDRNKPERLTESRKHEKEDVVEALEKTTKEPKYDFEDEEILKLLLEMFSEDDEEEESLTELSDQASRITARSQRSIVGEDLYNDRLLCLGKLNVPEEKLDALAIGGPEEKIYDWRNQLPLIMQIKTMGPIKEADFHGGTLFDTHAFDYMLALVRTVAEDVPFTIIPPSAISPRMTKAIRILREMYQWFPVSSFQDCMEERRSMRKKEQLENSVFSEKSNKMSEPTVVKS